MKTQDPDPDFILWTGKYFLFILFMIQFVTLLLKGDTVPHLSNDQLSPDAVIYIIKKVTQWIKEQFPTTSVYPVLGSKSFDLPNFVFPFVVSFN